MLAESLLVLSAITALLPKQKSGSLMGRRKREWSQEEIELFYHMSDTTIAKKLGIASATVNAKRKELEKGGIIPPRSELNIVGATRGRAKRVWLPEEIALFQTMSDVAIARKLGLSSVSVGYKRKELEDAGVIPPRSELNIVGETRGRAKRVWLPEEIALFQTMSDQAIARKLGLSAVSVGNKRKELLDFSENLKANWEGGKIKVSYKSSYSGPDMSWTETMNRAMIDGYLVHWSDTEIDYFFPKLTCFLKKEKDEELYGEGYLYGIKLQNKRRGYDTPYDAEVRIHLHESDELIFLGQFELVHTGKRIKGDFGGWQPEYRCVRVG